MEYVTTGHWIFAGVTFLIFIGVIVWSYRKDINIHRVHFKGASIFTLVSLVAFFLIFIFKRIL
jgi:hypothetical protein